VEIHRIYRVLNHCKLSAFGLETPKGG
jgi:hypothetical protein